MRRFEGQKNTVTRIPGWPLMYNYTPEYLACLAEKRTAAEGDMPMVYVGTVNGKNARLYGCLTAGGDLYGAWAEYEHEGKWHRLRNLELLQELKNAYVEATQAGGGHREGHI